MLFCSTPKGILKDKGEEDSHTKSWIENAITVAFSVVCIFCFFSALTTSIIYSLLGLYSKTPLCMSCDDKFIKFFAEMAGVRQFGYGTTMVASLLSLQLTFIFSILLFLQDQGRIRYISSGAAFLLSIHASIVSGFIVKAAWSKLLFSWVWGKKGGTASQKKSMSSHWGRRNKKLHTSPMKQINVMV